MKNLFTASVLALSLSAGLAACSPESKTPEPEVTETPVVTEETPVAEIDLAIPASDSVYPFSIGALNAAALKSATFTPPNDGSTFAIGEDKADVDALLTENGVSTETLELSVQPMLVLAGEHTILFDTGPGASSGFADALAASGTDPADVTDIFISHSHFDHVGGLVTEEGASAFPNASIFMSEAEWAFMQENADEAAIVAAVSDQVKTFEPNTVLIPDLVTAVEVKGHTPGHSAYRLSSGEDTLLYVGDTVHHYIISVQEPDWTVKFDSDPETAEASRKALLEAEATSGEPIYAYHFPFPGVGIFTTNDDGTIIWQAE